MGTPARSRSVFAGFLAVPLAWSTGCVDSYDQQPHTAYYVAPPPPVAAVAPASAPATDGSLAASAPGAEVSVGDYADTDPAALQDFREPLAPYGTWINDPTYGTVWVPREDVVGADFVPYQTAGHWAYDDDYVWVSDYSWGWAPFHYGRWVSMNNRGWAWIPGRTYSGAWVVWRTGPSGYGYVGWAPMSPSWYWFDGYAYGLSVAMWHHPHYAYCHRDYLFSRNVTRHVVRGRDAQVHDARTTNYKPARPAVDARTPAKPSVDDRTAARPTVNEPTPASPSVDPKPGQPSGGSKAFSRGPDPQSIGIDSSKIARVSPDDKELSRAREFAVPASAIRMGATPPNSSAKAVGKLAERSSSSSTSSSSTESTPKIATSVGRGPLMDAPMMMGPRPLATPLPAEPSQAAAASTAVRSQPAGSMQSTAPTLAPTARSDAQTMPRLTAPSGPAPAQAQAASSLSTPSASTFARSNSNVAPSYAPRATTPSMPRAPSYAPSTSLPSRSPSPSFSAPRSTAPSYSAPSRSSSPSFSAPSRSSSPSFSAPSRSTPSRSPSVAPSRSYSSSPSRTFSAPSRSSSPSRSMSSPSRSSGGSRSFSSSRGRR